ncbi:hypothetical protein F5148DRAFT_1201405 [Russula earlei]|uniref:Uncharacterized protein n=1 Tax=Russula earlei TaxID=71964 RepID=A0ACC0U9M6_9AGAM|nr:hypothetical protein F5148DRAFT_1201405 [Russula earlei]
MRWLGYIMLWCVGQMWRQTPRTTSSPRVRPKSCVADTGMRCVEGRGAPTRVHIPFLRLMLLRPDPLSFDRHCIGRVRRHIVDDCSHVTTTGVGVGHVSRQTAFRVISNR